MELENNIKAALADIESFRTTDCLDLDAIQCYSANKLDAPEREGVEQHLHTCLYCLKQLNDMTALQHYQKQLSPKLQNKGQQAQTNAPSFSEKFLEFFSFAFNPWRLSAIGLATAWVIFIASSLTMRQDGSETGFPTINRAAFVSVQALNETGSVLKEQQGVVVGSEGLIAANLSHLAGASRLRVTFKDGSTRDIDRIWKDDDKNLAVLKTDAHALSSIPLGDIKEIVGKKIYAAADFAVSGIKISEAVASDIRELPSHKKGGNNKFIQVATQTRIASNAVIVDEQGHLLGFMVTDEKHINLATPVDDVARLAKSGKAIPVSELKNVNFSADALNYYMKGILARDSQRWDEAVGHLQKAVQLNPHLTGAHNELGYIYYKRQQYQQEALEYEAVLKIQPDNVDALFNMAENLESRGRYNEAIGYYEKALSLDPSDAETLNKLGLAYLAQGEKNKALRMYEQLQKIDRGSSEMQRRLIR
jgi:Flp pilus assembly protein TadD